MIIGQKIKELRINNNLTQEQLAELLCISFQAVSKWETNVSTPDILMIAPLTKIFHVSADELLCLNDSPEDERYNELLAAYNQTYKTEDFAKRQEICETAVREYPGNMKFLSNLAWVVSNRSFEYENHDEYVAQQEKAIKLFDSVIKNCGNEILKSNAIEGITQLLGWRGRYDEAKKYAELLPKAVSKTRESVLENCLSGEELIRFKQERLKSDFEGVLWELSLLPTGEIYTDLIETLIQTMFPDGNYIEFNHSLFYAYQRRVNHEIRTKESPDIDMIFKWLDKMFESAKQYDMVAYDKPGVYKYNSPWFNRIKTDTREWLGSEGSRMCDDMKQYLEDSKFDFVRSDMRFSQLYNSLLNK